MIVDGHCLDSIHYLQVHQSLIALWIDLTYAFTLNHNELIHTLR